VAPGSSRGASLVRGLSVGAGPTKPTAPRSSIATAITSNLIPRLCSDLANYAKRGCAMTAGLFDYIEAFADEILIGAIKSADEQHRRCAEIADAASGAGSAVLMCGPSSAPRWDRWLGFGFPVAYLFRMLHLSFEAARPEWSALLPLQELQEGFHLATNSVSCNE
jgi:hypothetical protein